MPLRLMIKESTPPVELQLSLHLEWGSTPWEGVSSRVLTKGKKVLFLRQGRQKHERSFLDPDQYDLFLAAIPGRPRYGGAPSLLPLPRRS